MKEKDASFLTHYNTTSESLDEQAFILKQLIWGYRNSHRSTLYFRRLNQIQPLERRVKKACSKLVTTILERRRGTGKSLVSGPKWKVLVTNTCHLVAKELSIIADAGRKITGLLSMKFWITFSSLFISVIAKIYQHRVETLKELTVLWKNLPGNSDAKPRWNHSFSLQNKDTVGLEEFWRKRRNILVVLSEEAKVVDIAREKPTTRLELEDNDSEEEVSLTRFLESESEDESSSGSESSSSATAMDTEKSTTSPTVDVPPPRKLDTLSCWLEEFEEL